MLLRGERVVRGFREISRHHAESVWRGFVYPFNAVGRRRSRRTLPLCDLQVHVYTQGQRWSRTEGTYVHIYGANITHECFTNRA